MSSIVIRTRMSDFKEVMNELKSKSYEIWVKGNQRRSKLINEKKLNKIDKIDIKLLKRFYKDHGFPKYLQQYYIYLGKVSTIHNEYLKGSYMGKTLYFHTIGEYEYHSVKLTAYDSSDDDY